MATQLAERTSNDPVALFRQTLTTPAFAAELKMALPNHIPVDRFIRVAQTAVQQNPDLLNGQKVERRSLFGALVRAAQDGLLPDGREGAIVPFRGKAQWMPMVNGIMKKVRNSGEIANWEAAAVFEKDTFERLLGDDQRIYHKPYEDGDPGGVVGAYSIVTFKDGSKSRDFLPRWRIERAREQNPVGKNSLMWTKFYDEGAIKTVIRHHAKRLPMSTDVDAIFERDETMTPPGGFTSQPSPDPEPTAPVTRLDALEHQIGGTEVEEPVVQPEITEQAETIEAEIEPEEDRSDTNEAPAEINDTAEHPAVAAADAIIAEINDPACNAVMDVSRVLTKHDLDICAMPDDQQMRIEIAADKRRQEIRAAQQRQPSEEPAE